VGTSPAGMGAVGALACPWEAQCGESRRDAVGVAASRHGRLECTCLPLGGPVR